MRRIFLVLLRRSFMKASQSDEDDCAVRLLVAEDEGPIRELLVRGLSEIGYVTGPDAIAGVISPPASAVLSAATPATRRNCFNIVPRPSPARVARMTSTILFKTLDPPNAVLVSIVVRLQFHLAECLWPVNR